jgi:hypothetical protein
MIFRFVYLPIIILFPIIVSAQRWELGFEIGPSNYQGDLAPDISLKETHLSGGLFFKKNLSPYFSSCFGLNQGQISGNDKNIASLKIRNLSFQSNITEIFYQLEFNFLPFSLGLNSKRFTPYTYCGISLFRFEPKALYNNQLIKLQPLDTEGRKMSNKKKSVYSLYQVAIPIGGGFKFNLSEKFIIGVNLAFRYTFTDYLDDVSTTYYDVALLQKEYGSESSALSDRSGEVNSSKIGFIGKQRGRSDHKDWYIFGGFFISYKIKNSACFEF